MERHQLYSGTDHFDDGGERAKAGANQKHNLPKSSAPASLCTSSLVESVRHTIIPTIHPPSTPTTLYCLLAALLCILHHIVPSSCSPLQASAQDLHLPLSRNPSPLILLVTYKASFRPLRYTTTSVAVRTNFVPSALRHETGTLQSSLRPPVSVRQLQSASAPRRP